MGRLIAQKLGEVLSASFVVENRTGASGAIGTQYVAQQAADGYTLLLVASPFTTVSTPICRLPNGNGWLCLFQEKTPNLVFNIPWI